jgi:hypothetical protein
MASIHQSIGAAATAGVFASGFRTQGQDPIFQHPHGSHGMGSHYGITEAKLRSGFDTIPDAGAEPKLELALDWYLAQEMPNKERQRARDPQHALAMLKEIEGPSDGSFIVPMTRTVITHAWQRILKDARITGAVGDVGARVAGRESSYWGSDPLPRASKPETGSSQRNPLNSSAADILMQAIRRGDLL